VRRSFYLRIPHKSSSRKKRFFSPDSIIFIGWRRRVGGVCDSTIPFEAGKMEVGEYGSLQADLARMKNIPGICE
jgi:hypothetical protein